MRDRGGAQLSRALHDRTDLVVLLGPINDVEEDRFLSQAAEIPVLVTGHIHDGLEHEVSRKGRVRVRVKGCGEELGRLELTVHTEKKAPVSWTWKRLPVDGGEVEPAGDVSVQVNRGKTKSPKQVDQPVAFSLRYFDPSEIKHLIEQACATRPAPISAVINQGEREILPRGPLPVRNLWNVLPFDHCVVFGKFKGRDPPPMVLGSQRVDPEREYTLAVKRFHCGQSERPRTISLERQILGRRWFAPRCAARLAPQKKCHRMRLGYPWPRYISHPRPNSATKKQTNTYRP